MSTAYDLVVARLEARGARRQGLDWSCPAHKDDRPSLSVRGGKDRALVHCQAGCSTEDVVAALGLTMADLFDDAGRLDARAEAATYDYVDERGEVLFQVVRFYPKDFRQRRPDGTWNLNGVRRVLYRLPAVLEAVQERRPVYIVEGEKDVAAIERGGGVATCNSGGALKWRDEYSAFLAGADVIVVADKDEPGRRHAAEVARSLQGVASSVRVVEAAEGKDAADHLAAGLPLSALVPVEEAAASDVALADLLDGVCSFIRRYVVLTPEQLTAVALWGAHAHAIEAAETTPYLDVTSPLPECGKTRLQETLEPLLPRVVRTANISDAALFRTVADTEKGRAVLLLDEADAIFNARSEREDLRALLNAGYRRGAVVARVEMASKAGVVRYYDAFGAKAIAGIGQRPETIRSRSIPIVMRRRARGEHVERFRERTVRNEAVPLREALAAQAGAPGVLARLGAARPEVPDALTDRQQDAWEPLLAIADEAGGDWPTRARAAAVVLHGGRLTDEALGELLLVHLRELFGDRDRMSTVEILRGLIDREDGPWAGWWANDVEAGRTRGPASKLAHLLHPFEVEPRKMRLADGSTARGYLAAELGELWARYLHSPELERNNGTSQVDGQIGTEQESDVFRPKTASDQQSSVVPSGNGELAPPGDSAEAQELIYPEPEDVRTAARLFGWPRVNVGGVRVDSTEAAWSAWLSRSTPDRRLVAYGVLEEMG